MQHGIALRCGGEANRRPCQGGVAFRHADEVDDVLGRHGNRQRLRIGIPDVLEREPDQLPRHVERVLTSPEHAGEPVDRCIRLAVAHLCNTEIRL
jgi:hypothetical protein